MQITIITSHICCYYDDAKYMYKMQANANAHLGISPSVDEAMLMLKRKSIIGQS
jgi:hypothetical protein